MILDILKEGDERLTQVSVPVENVEDVKELIADMRETLLNNIETGLGLAAVQVGQNVQVLIMREGLNNRHTPVTEKPLMALINPRIKKIMNEKKNTYREGCLSVPDKTAVVERPSALKVQFLDEQGISRTMRFEGMEAVVFQHEYDHLQGLLMTTTPGFIKSDIKPKVDGKEAIHQLEEEQAAIAAANARALS